MALAGINNIRLIELSDTKISKLLTDTTGSPTYGTSVDLAAITKLQVAPKTETKKLHGDSVLLDVYQRTLEVEVEVEFGEFVMDAYPIFCGGSYGTTGTSPNQIVRYSLVSTNTAPPYWKIEGRWTYTGIDNADAHVILYKVKATDLPAVEINDASGNFGVMKVKGLAVPCVSNNSWFDIVINETATAIS
jgi:hypothetical protein